MPLRLQAAGKTDVGLQREGNEDAFYTRIMGDTVSSGIFIVSDGMGGYHAGEIASQIAVETISGELAPVLDPTIPQTTVKLNKVRKRTKSGKKASAANDAASDSEGAGEESETGENAERA